MKSRLLKILILVFCVSFALFAVSCNKNKDNSNSESESITIQSESIEESISTLESDEATSVSESIEESEEVSQSESELVSETESEIESESAHVCEYSQLRHNETHHWYECICGEKDTTTEELHIPSAPATATTPQICTTCNFVIQNETGILFKTLTVDGTNVYGKFDNATIEFSFANEIAVVGNADFIVSLDSYGTQTVITKTVPLNVGDNTFYVFETIEGKLAKTYVVTIRRRPIYTVSFNVSGGSSVSSQQIEEDSLATEPTTTRAGYTFTGWDYDFSTPIVNNVTISANWQAHTNTEYKVEYYLQNLEDDNYTLDHTDTLRGTTDTLATAEIKDIAHFTYNASQSTISGNIDGNGSRVLVVKYTRDKYGIVANNNNAKAGTSTQINSTYKFDKEITLTATTNAGYTWLGWYEGEDLVCESEEFTFNAEKGVTYTASWSANEDTEYKVEYYLQNLEDDNYTLDHTDTLYGTTDTNATAQIKTFAHFTYNEVESVIRGNIDGDGSRVLVVKYTRNSYRVIANANNEKAGSITVAGTYKFDKEITLTATTNAGYTWLGWYEGEDLVCESEEFTFNAEKGVTYTATWFTHTDTAYKVEYYLQNLDDDNYTLDHTDELEGTTDTTATAEIKDFAHFTYNASQSTISGNIDGNGSRVLVVKYTRDQYLISVETENCSVSNDGYHKYQKEVTVTATPNLGYDFIGWYSGEELLSTDLTYMFTIEFDVVAKFELKEGLSNFNFTSTTTSCTITGVKDKTVTEISVPDCVTNINSGAFSGCSSLTSVTLPFVGGSKTATTASTSTLFGYIFGAANYEGGVEVKQTCQAEEQKYCSYGMTMGLYPGACGQMCSGQHYYYAQVIMKISYYIPSNLTSVKINGGDILYSAFSGCTSLTNIILGEGVTSIDKEAFTGCTSLTNIEVSDNNTTFKSIDGNVYTKDGTSLILYAPGKTDAEFIMPNNVTSIGDYAFYKCTSLTSIVLSDSVTTIGDYAFANCSSLASVDMGDKVISIGDYAFYKCTSLTCIVLPDSVTTIGDYAFANCSSLASVVIGDGVTSIGYYAFHDCDSLTSVEIGDSVTTIGNYAFSDCDSLTSIVIPDSVTGIGDSAFYSCDSLTSVVIGDSVTGIGNMVFMHCTSLTSITFKDTATWYDASGSQIDVTNATKNVTYIMRMYNYDSNMYYYSCSYLRKK